MNDGRSMKKEKNQHIQVFVRVRPSDNNEQIGKSITVVEIPSNKEVIIRERPQDKLSKKFTFDKVFGPSSKQVEVYKAVVSPLLEEVLAGYNCTVFAYGQTGTGKTYTMEGVSNNPALHWQSDSTAGIIPRSLSHLFDELRMLDGQEYTVRVSFLELYNEELFDLLSPTDDASKIRLYEDASRKGAVIIHGLEEVTVHNKNEVYKILEKGSEKRQTAATLMNAHSSRSHTVFSITIHIKENTVDGEELLKTGKLNLVDLAGSENVGRSGAVDRRAREAGSINQSLLTLGRVITALVERAPHVPYRESKLTRLLQESLGGRTKTSIIATISPASVNLEETLSTLDYAYRAKNITNRPEINQKLSKKALLKEYTEEIERLRRDLLATRERNGVYLAQDNYNEMQFLIAHQEKEIEEKINHIKVLEETMMNKEKLFNELQLQHEAQINKLHEIENHLTNTKHTLKSTVNDLKKTQQDRDEQKLLVEKHFSNEKVLLMQAETLLNVADEATSDTHKLHDKIVRKTKVEEENEYLGQQFRSNITNRFLNIETDFSVHTQELVQFCVSTKAQIENVITEGLTATNTATEALTSEINNSYTTYEGLLEKMVDNAVNITECECNSLNTMSTKLIQRVHKIEDLIKNEIAEKLRAYNASISQKLENVAILAKSLINELCDFQLRECDQICKNIQEIQQVVQNVFENQNQSMQERQQFTKILTDFKSFQDRLFQQSNQFYRNEEQRYTAVSEMLKHVNETCENINNKTSNNSGVSIDKKKNLELNIETDISTIKNDIDRNTQENLKLSEQTLEECNTLTKDIEADLNSRYDALKEHSNAIENNATQLREKMTVGKNSSLSKTNDIRSIIEESYASVNVSRKLENQATESIDWNNRITSQLHITQHEVEKFLIEDLRHDVPTGSTPVRREFRYPRQLSVTSPHERIIQRFREARQCVKSPNNENHITSTIENTNLNKTPENITAGNTMTSPIFDDITITASTPNCDSTNRHFEISGPVNYQLTKASSTSDIIDLSKQSVEYSILSEPDLCIKNNNKENDKKDFLKPEQTKPKRSLKMKTTNRKILGSYN